MNKMDEAITEDVRRARLEQPPHPRERFCKICGPFMLASCPAAPEHDLRPEVHHRIATIGSIGLSDTVTGVRAECSCGWSVTCPSGETKKVYPAFVEHLKEHDVE